MPAATHATEKSLFLGSQNLTHLAFITFTIEQKRQTKNWENRYASTNLDLWLQIVKTVICETIGKIMLTYQFDPSTPTPIPRCVKKTSILAEGSFPITNKLGFQ